MREPWVPRLERLDEFRYEIPKGAKPAMRTNGIVFADERMLEQVKRDQALEQLANAACMPGIVGSALAMPDIHQGYGMPVGGVAAFDAEDGVVSPGSVGFDINCGVRLLRTDLTEAELRPRLRELVDEVFRLVPTGASRGSVIGELDPKDLEALSTRGVGWAEERGYAWPEDRDHIEARGCLEDADFSAVSARALHRGRDEVGSLGSGNHFLEVQKVEKVRDAAAAKALGLDRTDQVAVMIHTGSRGFGHQIATDYIEACMGAMRELRIELPDRQLACAPVHSRVGEGYWKAMCCGANFAWTNRQLLTHAARTAFAKTFGRSAEDLGMRIVYDVCHNIGKFEEYEIDGRRRRVLVHRKGATRAFPAGHRETPSRYRDVGQPVLIPGDMGSGSYVLVGLPTAMERSFGSSCHGAGRVMSRAAATRTFRANEVKAKLAQRGVYVRAGSIEGIVEEAPGAYKDVDHVVRIAEGAGLTRIVARMAPLGVVKG